MNEKRFSWLTSIVYVFVALFLVFTLTVCSKADPYKGTSEGYAGPITIEINVEAGKITGGEVVSISETGFAIPAAEAIIEQAIKNGNADNLDVVSGSTVTSNATIKAIKSALAVANGISYEKEIYAAPDPIMVKVTISDGKITGGEIISDSKSAKAFPGVTAILAQAVENGNADNLDAVSGVTASSKSAIETLQALLASAGGMSYEKEIYAAPDPIMVKVTINNGKITGGEIISDSKSAKAFPGVTAILAQAVENGNADNLDAVSGVTASSKSAIETLQALLASAGGMGVAGKEASTDIVIIGAGGAGLSAAVVARNAGVSVIILEKMGSAGGNTKYATGGLNASETVSQTAKGITDSNQQFYDDTMKGGGNINNPDLVRILTGKSGETTAWLTSLGMDLNDVGRLGGATNNRAHRPTGGSAVGAHFSTIMLKAAEDVGAEIRYNSTVTSIIDTDGKASGVTVSGPDGDYTITAKAVIVATGGFGANAELVSSFVPELKGFGTTNHKGATGDALELVKPFNAALVDIEQIQTHPTVVPVNNIMITEAVRGNGAIMTNLEGKRFEQEMATRDVMSEAILSQTGKTAYLIFDQGIRESLKAVETYYKQGLLTEGATLADLAKNLNMPASDLEATVASYNMSVDSKTDAEFGRADMPRKIETGPFYAVEVAPAVHHTMGGLKINTETEVLNTSGAVIPGLYAAGEVTGGIHGANRLGGNALSDIATFGRIAGIEAAAYVK